VHWYIEKVTVREGPGDADKPSGHTSAVALKGRSYWRGLWRTKIIALGRIQCRNHVIRRYQCCRSAPPVDHLQMAYSTDWAKWLLRFYYEGLHRKWWQDFAAVLDDLLAVAVGKKSEVSDLHKSAGQHMQQKSPDEFDGIQRHLFHLIVVLGIAPAKMHLAMIQSQQSPLEIATRCV